MENDKLFDLMSKMYAEVQDIKEEMQNGFNDIKKDMSFLMEGQNKIANKLNELEGKNAANHISMNTKLNKVSEDLDFLSHKEFQTEKEMYLIKQKLNRRRKNIK